MQRMATISCALAAVLAVSSAHAQTVPGDFDAEAAKASLGTIEYKSCGLGGSGSVLVTFGTDGTAERVAIAEGSYTAEVALCIARRFMATHVPAFTGPSRTVKWGIKLPQPEGTAPPPPPQPDPANSPDYGAKPFNGPRVIEADRPMPLGYHEEERHKVGALITGSITGGMGVLMGIIALAFAGSSRSSEKGIATAYGILSVIHLGVGVPFFIIGLGTKKVYVRNEVSVHVVPVVTADSGGASLAIRF